MALKLDYEFSYQTQPTVPLRITHGTMSAETEALLDTGADVSLFDAAVAELLNVPFEALDTFRVLGVGGATSRVPYSWLEAAVVGLPDDQAATRLAVGFVPGLAKSVGNLLGRDFLQSFDFGLHHTVAVARRRLYLGRR